MSAQTKEGSVSAFWDFRAPFHGLSGAQMLRRIGTTLLLTLAGIALGGAVGVLLRDHVPLAIALGGGSVITGVLFGGLQFWSDPGRSREVVETGLEDGRPAHWVGVEAGGSRIVPGDGVWVPLTGFALTSGVAVGIPALSGELPVVLVVAWPLGTGLYFWLVIQRMRRLSLLRSRLIVRDDGTVAVADSVFRPATSVPMDPHHLLWRHRDGAVTVAFGDMSSRSRRYLRLIVGTPLDTTRLRAALGASLVLVRIDPGEGFLEALRTADG